MAKLPTPPAPPCTSTRLPASGMAGSSAWQGAEQLCEPCCELVCEQAERRKQQFGGCGARLAGGYLTPSHSTCQAVRPATGTEAASWKDTPAGMRHRVGSSTAANSAFVPAGQPVEGWHAGLNASSVCDTRPARKCLQARLVGSADAGERAREGSKHSRHGRHTALLTKRVAGQDLARAGKHTVAPLELQAMNQTRLWPHETPSNQCTPRPLGQREDSLPALPKNAALQPCHTNASELRSLPCCRAAPPAPPLPHPPPESWAA